MEITIAMLLSAIVISITYTVFSIVTRSYHGYQLKHEGMASVLRLDELLQKDFERAEIILKDTDGIALQSAALLVKYRFYPDYVLRISAITDTLKVKTDSLMTSFEKKEISTTSTDIESKRIDQLGMIVTFEKETIPYYYHKLYSSENLINRKNNAVN
jgi:hypothetical protein